MPDGKMAGASNYFFVQSNSFVGGNVNFIVKYDYEGNYLDNTRYGGNVQYSGTLHLTSDEVDLFIGYTLNEDITF